MTKVLLFFAMMLATIVCFFSTVFAVIDVIEGAPWPRYVTAVGYLFATLTCQYVAVTYCSTPKGSNV